MTFVTVPCYKDSILLLVDINFFHWPSAQKCRHGKPQQIRTQHCVLGLGDDHCLDAITHTSFPASSAPSCLSWSATQLRLLLPNLSSNEIFSYQNFGGQSQIPSYAPNMLPFLDNSRARGMLWVAEQRKSAGALLKWHFTSNEFCYLHFSSLLSISLVVYLTSVHLLHSYFPFSPLELYSSYICSFFLVVLFSWGNIRVRL